MRRAWTPANEGHQPPKVWTRPTLQPRDDPCRRVVAAADAGGRSPLVAGTGHPRVDRQGFNALMVPSRSRSDEGNQQLLLQVGDVERHIRHPSSKTSCHVTPRSRAGMAAAKQPRMTPVQSRTCRRVTRLVGRGSSDASARPACVTSGPAEAGAVCVRRVCGRGAALLAVRSEPVLWTAAFGWANRPLLADERAPQASSPTPPVSGRASDRVAHVDHTIAEPSMVEQLEVAS